MIKTPIDVTKNVPETISGDVNAKIENITQCRRRDGSIALMVEMVVTQDGTEWYNLKTYISSDPKFHWLHRQFWGALGYAPEVIEHMDLMDATQYNDWKTYLMINIAHNGKYVNIKKWYPKKRNNYIPVPWHWSDSEKYGGVAYQAKAVPGATETTPKRIDDRSLDDILGPEEPETTENSSKLTPQSIDLSWVTDENLVTELLSRGYGITAPGKPKAKPKPVFKKPDPVEGYDLGDFDFS